MSELLAESELQEQTKALNGWNMVAGKLILIRKFNDFIQAIEFVNKLVEPSEAIQHHPDIEISYNKVTINLTTHDAGGLTQKDFDLARTISQIS